MQRPVDTKGRGAASTGVGSRHDRVWLDPATWRDGLHGPLDDARIAEVDRWVERRRALVVRRRDPDVADDVCCLAIALPLALGRRRIALAVRRSAVVGVAAPLSLAEVIGAAPFRWRDALTDLRSRAADLDTALFVYGSFAWQAISGECCVTPTSDLDLLWDARDADQVRRVIGLLTAWETDSGLRADGEARFDDGDAVAWRELATGAARVLVKRDDGVALKPNPVRDRRCDGSARTP